MLIGLGRAGIDRHLHVHVDCTVRARTRVEAMRNDYLHLLSGGAEPKAYFPLWLDLTSVTIGCPLSPNEIPRSNICEIDARRYCASPVDLIVAGQLQH